MDFMADQLVTRRRIRLLTIVNVFTHESLAIKVSRWLRHETRVDLTRLSINESGETMPACQASLTACTNQCTG